MTVRPIAIVTGASQARDIGAAICRQLATAGHDLVFTYFKATADWSTSFTTELESQDVRIRAIELDLSQTDAVDATIATSSLVFAEEGMDGYLHLWHTCPRPSDASANRNKYSVPYRARGESSERDRLTAIRRLLVP